MLSLVSLAPKLTCAQHKGLKDLKQVRILIEGLPKEGENLGLTTEGLKDLALVALKSNLPGLKIFDKATAMFYVIVNVLRISAGLYAVCINVEIDQWSAILREEDDVEVARQMVTVWNSGEVLAGSGPELSTSINDAIRTLTTRFAAEYYRQNG